MSDHRSIDLWKQLLTAILLTLIIVPPLIILIRKSSRLWIKEGIEGENKKLDLNEIWEMIFMYMGVGCFFTMVYMIVMKTAYSVNYELYEYGMVFSGTLGNNAASTFIIWVKQKYSK